MLNVVLIGAGDIGQYIARILSQENHNVILIDREAKRLEGIASRLDIGTRTAVGTDWQLLDELLEIDPDFLIALTPDDEFNLTLCSIAKNLGYRRTVARVKDDRFLNKTRLDFGRVFHVDHFICPELLAAHEVMKYILSAGCIAVESFANGAIQMRTFPISESWKKGETAIKHLNLPTDINIGLIRRPKGEGDYELLFPHENDHILPKDEATCIGEPEAVANLHKYFSSHTRKIRSVILLGGSQVALNLAGLLKKEGTSIRILEKSESRCLYLANLLPSCTIINLDPTHLDSLLREKVDQADLVLVSTESDEISMMAALMAKEAGAKHIAIVVSRAEYHPVAEKLGITYAVSPRLAAASRLLSLILSSRVISCVSLYENRAEVVEIKISIDSKIVGIPIHELERLLPQDFLIAVIQNRGRMMIADGNRILSPGDSVIVVTNPRHLTELERMF